MAGENENLKLFDLLKGQKWGEFEEYIGGIEHVDLNIRDDQNNYLLTYAVLYDKPGIVRLLIEKGARIDIVDNEDKSILYIAIRYDYQEVIDILLEYNENNIGIFLFDIRDRNNNVPIHYAILFNNPVALKKLLVAGASPNIPEKNGYNSLHLAVYMRSFRMCGIIIEFNIDINARCNSGETALHIGCNLQLIEIVKVLMENGVNVNIQDYEHEYTALHYCVNLNNKELVGILLKRGADVNLQDIVGNTVVHYAVSENNLECLTMILGGGGGVNLNLWNLDGKIALLMALEIDMNNLGDYIDILLPGSNLNIQDNNGNTCLHLVCVKELWKEYQPRLIKKKLDVFLPNKLNERPIDYVGAKDFESFLQMVVSSYLFRLRKSDIYWNTEWENMCKKELFYGEMNEEERKVVKEVLPGQLSSGKVHDVCRDIIENKLRKTYERKDMKVCSKSFPLKRGFMCLDLSEGQNLNVCTFTGSTLDILIGLIYLLNKHPNACSTFSRNFTENKELCKFYRSIGIIMNTRCEFLNFEVVWVHHKLYLVEDFYDNFRRCLSKGDKQFVIVPLGIEMRVGSHANYLIYDKSVHEVERFEPHGSSTPPGLHYDPTLLDNILEVRFKELDPEIKYIRPKDYLPKVGFQLFDISERKKKRIGDPGGFCALWTIWYVDMRLSHKELPRGVLVKKMIQTIKSQNISFKNLIRNYARNIIDIRDRIMSKANININDWLNDQYTESQIDIVLKELTREVSLLVP
ncbi:MAG: ankyrin repeat protein [Hyperionvirus sp.]|uniref:Ankyrin repeat protein n=1 Tax=Hyperionvirus sp. TaxID=2487770 RepID=A0A3G5A8L1_9VIRU|nr:MAG: ankyrin repeat protein [Hyperionvirus sp.]